ncbi:MAG: epimerase, partial [Pseudomonadales bacterium]|nr:epimerase [Pseudomonadales bacterium]
IDALIEYARGKLVGLPVFAPKGGTNHISTRSLAQAAAHALESGESGKAYLLGDVNYSWKEYLELWFSAVGNPTKLEVKADDHPMLPNAIMFAGAGATVNYEPDAKDMAQLGYERNMIEGVIQDIVAANSGG